jgi:hypothetical protein
MPCSRASRREPTALGRRAEQLFGRGGELPGLADHGQAGSEEARRLLAPAGVGREEEEGVVEDGAEGLDAERFGGRKLSADGELSVPEVDDARVVEEPGVPRRALVGREGRRPDRVDAKLARGVALEDLLADPTGPGEAGASGGGEQQDEARHACVLVEPPS